MSVIERRAYYRGGRIRDAFVFDLCPNEEGTISAKIIVRSECVFFIRQLFN